MSKKKHGLEQSHQTGPNIETEIVFFYIFFGNIEFKARKIIYNAIHYTMFDLNVCGVSVFALKSRMKQLIKQHKSTSHRVIFLYFSSFSSDILHLNAFQTHTPICLTKFLFILSPVHSFMLFSVYYIYSVKLLA